MNDDLDHALADLERAVTMAPDDPSTYFTRGFCRYRQGQLDKALADYERALKLDGDYAEAHRERGFIRGLNDDFDGAFKDLDRAIELDKEDGAAHLRRGIILARKQQFDGAIAEFNKARKLDADNAETHFHLAIVQIKIGKTDEAVADYREVIRLEPRDPDGYKKWDVNPDRSGESNISRLETALAKYKDEARGHYLKGVALHKEEKLDEAVAEYDRAVLLYPRLPEVHYNRGLAFRRKGDLEKNAFKAQGEPEKAAAAEQVELEKAAADYSQAIELDPKFTAAYSNRGFVNFKLGDYDGALADFRKVLELDPKNADAKKSIEVIEQMSKQGDTP
jgi:tetratricopeptide (TPR) repeat protein